MVRLRIPFNLTVDPKFIEDVRTDVKQHNIKSVSLLFEVLYHEWKKKGMPGLGKIKKKGEWKR